MATTRALQGDGELIAASEKTVTSALGFTVSAFLPPIIDDLTHSRGKHYLTGYPGVFNGEAFFVYANGAGDVTIRDSHGQLVAVVASLSSKRFEAWGKEVNNGDPDSWVVLDWFWPE